MDRKVSTLALRILVVIVRKEGSDTLSGRAHLSAESVSCTAVASYGSTPEVQP